MELSLRWFVEGGEHVAPYVLLERCCSGESLFLHTTMDMVSFDDFFWFVVRGQSTKSMSACGIKSACTSTCILCLLLRVAWVVRRRSCTVFLAAGLPFWFDPWNIFDALLVLFSLFDDTCIQQRIEES